MLQEFGGQIIGLHGASGRGTAAGTTSTSQYAKFPCPPCHMYTQTVTHTNKICMHKQCNDIFKHKKKILRSMLSYHSQQSCRPWARSNPVHDTVPLPLRCILGVFGREIGKVCGCVGRFGCQIQFGKESVRALRAESQSA